MWTAEAGVKLRGQEAVFAEWSAQLGGRAFAMRSDLSASRLAPELAHISILDALDGRFVFRLAGGGLRQALGREPRGNAVADIPTCARAEGWTTGLTEAWKRRKPMAGQSRSNEIVHFWLRLPLSSDGVKADMVLCHDRYLGLEALADPERAAREADRRLRLDCLDSVAA